MRELSKEVVKIEAENLDIVDQVNKSLGVCDDKLCTMTELKNLVVGGTRGTALDQATVEAKLMRMESRMEERDRQIRSLRHC